MVHNALRGCHIMTVGLHENWTNQQIRNWVKEAGGISQARITQDTTHLVASKKEWEKKSLVVMDALKRKQVDLQEIHIVNFDWLADSFTKKTKKREKEYRFVLPGSQVTAESGIEPRSQAGLMKQLYEDHTLAPTAAQQALIEKKRQEKEEVAKEREEANMREFKESRMSVPELAAIFKKGAQKAKAYLLSDNHHVYVDSTGFHYDITLTKVDTKHNTNERYCLIIFESNHFPPTYALCTSFSGTRLETTNNIVVSVGSSWPTVYRAFSKAFFEKTGVKWDDRVKAAQKRREHEKAMKGKNRIGNGYAADQMSSGQPVRNAADFKYSKFQYYPPAYGPRGEGVEHIHNMKKFEPVNFTADDEADQDDSELTHPMAQPDFGPEEVEKFKSAVVQEDVNPYEDPFSFGKDGYGNVGVNGSQGEDHPGDAMSDAQLEEDLVAQIVAEADEHFNQGLENMDSNPDDFAGDSPDGKQTHDLSLPETKDLALETELGDATQAFPPETKLGAATQSNSQVPGKRKDSATPEDGPAEKKAKFDGEEHIKGIETQFRDAVDAFRMEQDTLGFGEGGSGAKV